MDRDHKNRVEAILFTTGKFLDLNEISRLCQISEENYINDLLNELKGDYGKINGALELVNQGNKWRLNIKKEYLFLTEVLLDDSELDQGTQKTLAIIAYKSPVLQSEIIKIRGNGAYDQIKLLKDLDFVISEKSGRTFVLKVSRRFYDYFDVVEDKLKSRLVEDGSKNENI
ncbi:SMC-Scp complex subunit ScpB [Candidatus Woesearchaeota archaeon]|nr:SMC-Scp complex subunit ScpB [Candidatus Woesearchaeota archaeon]